MGNQLGNGLEALVDEGHAYNLENDEANDALKRHQNKTLRELSKALRQNDKSGDMLTKSAKSTEQSVMLRQYGNVMFRQRRQLGIGVYSAHAYYCNGMAYALPDSEEFAASCINRAVLFMDIKLYNYALIDINRVLKLDQINPDVKAKSLLKKAECLKMLGDTATAASTLQEARAAINLVSNEFQRRDFFLQEFRSVKILKKKPVVEELKVSLPTLNPNSEVPCASDAVKIEYDATFGRHIIATKKIQTGEILAIEDIYYGFLNNSYLSFMYCSHCLKLAMTSVPCDNCSFISYCSEECKKLAWEQYHDIECRVRLLLERDEDYDPVDIKQLSYDVRLFIKAVKEEGIPNILNTIKTIDNYEDKRTKGFSENKFKSNKFCSVYSLSYNAKSSNLKLLRKQFSVLIKCLKLMKEETFKDIEEKSEIYNDLEKLFVKLSLISYTNVFEISKVSLGESCICNYDKGAELGTHRKDCMKHRGGHLAPFSSLINHSCHPNVNQLIFNGKIVTYSCRPINVSEQIFKSYQPNITQAKSVRQKLLKKYDFICHCDACEGNWPVLTNTDSNSLMETKMHNNPSLMRGYLSDFKKLYSCLQNVNISSKVRSEKRHELLKVLPKIIDAGYTILSKEEAAFATYYYQRVLSCVYQDIYLGEMEIKKF